jgi:hypothetical protein
MIVLDRRQLGAGLGLCGIVAHRLQDSFPQDKKNGVADASSFVYLTDGDTDALEKLRHNVRNNQRSERISCGERNRLLHLKKLMGRWMSY